ncbi:hypothetical protein NDU88_005039 [Pleurodeles waltl]|uniref:Uncharacterized protein n=1 Tax=Pleurodeles waltl TaxID=8319 RepID=A0AAV7TTN6_PLEWA|nr:hypothetical protein NDU88_005039 [Pleurodeles waltl]
MEDGWREHPQYLAANQVFLRHFWNSVDTQMELTDRTPFVEGNDRAELNCTRESLSEPTLPEYSVDSSSQVVLTPLELEILTGPSRQGIASSWIGAGRAGSGASLVSGEVEGVT